MLLTSVGWLSYTAINLREYRLLHVFVVIVGVRETKLTGETVHVFYCIWNRMQYASQQNVDNSVEQALWHLQRRKSDKFDIHPGPPETRDTRR